MTQPRSLVESALLTGLSVILYLGAEIPLLGTLLVFLCPVPLVILEMHHDLRMGAISLFVGTLLTMLMKGPISALSYALGFAVLGLALGRIIELRRSAVEILALGSLVSLLCELVLAVILFYVTGLNPLNLDLQGSEKLLDLIVKMPGGAEQAEMVHAQFEAALRILPLIIPAMLIMVSVFNTLICYWVSCCVIKRLNKIDLPTLPPFDNWRFPPSVLGAYFVALLCLYLGSRYQMEMFTRIGLNVQIISQFIFVVQGVSLIEYWMRKKGWRRGARVAIDLMLLFIPLFSSMVTYAGLLDMCWNFRVRYGGK